MTYIKLEDAVKIFNEIGLLDETKIVRLNQLQSIDFDKMIKEKFEMCREQASDSERHFGGMIVCEQLLNKLP